MSYHGDVKVVSSQNQSSHSETRRAHASAYHSTAVDRHLISDTSLGVERYASFWRVKDSFNKRLT
jgi:hypothetical protein